MNGLTSHPAGQEALVPAGKCNCGPCSVPSSESGHHPNARRRRKKLRKDGLVVEEDPEADAEDWEAERWSEGSEGRTGVKAVSWTKPSPSMSKQ